MTNLLLTAAILLTAVPAQARKKQPTTVIITAGQSNTDGRVMNSELPPYIIKNGYKHCYWCYGSGGKIKTKDGGFELFWPKMGATKRAERWAYDAVTYYRMEKALKKDFYVIKWSVGGTAIDTLCRSTSGKYWTADPAWLSNNRSTLNKGKSLLKSFTEEIDACIDDKLEKLPNGYDIKAMLWHQGESDMKAGSRYYDNLKAVVQHVRQHLAEKTGEARYLQLPFICGTVSRSNKCYSKEVEEAMLRLQNEDKNFHVIDMSDGELQKDRLHFTAKSAEYLGNAMYNKLVDIGAVKGKKSVLQKSKKWF